MKKIILLLILTTSTLFSNDKVVILSLKAVNIDAIIADAATEVLATTMSQSKVYSIIERGQLDKIFTELSLTSNDDFNESQAIEIGKLAKADIVALGSITKIGTTHSINVRLIDVETGTIIIGQSASTEDINDLNNKIIYLAHLLEGDVNSKIVVNNSPINSIPGGLLKAQKLKLLSSKIKVYVKSKEPAFSKIILTPIKNDVIVSSILIEFRDKTEAYIFEEILIPSKRQHVINFSDIPKQIKKITIETKSNDNSFKILSEEEITISAQ